MYKVKLEIEIWCDESEIKGVELSKDLDLPIPPYVGLEIYHTGYAIVIESISIEYELSGDDISRILCMCKTIEDGNILIIQGLLDNGWMISEMEIMEESEVRQLVTKDMNKFLEKLKLSSQQSFG